MPASLSRPYHGAFSFQDSVGRAPLYSIESECAVSVYQAMASSAYPRRAALLGAEAFILA